MIPNIINFRSLSYAEQCQIIKNVLNDPDDKDKVRYRNSTGKIILEHGELYSLWCDQKIPLDCHSMQYVHMSSTAYTDRAFITFKSQGRVIKTNTRDVWGKKDVDKIYSAIIEKAIASNPSIDECEIYISSFKKDYRHAS